MVILSHPEKLLIEHLQNVAELCYKIIKKKDIKFCLDTINSANNQNIILSDLAYICGAFHDIGKASSYFQDYIRDTSKEVTNLKNHSLISSLFVKEISKKYLNKFQFSDLTKQILIHFCYTVVKRHHGNLDNFDDELFIENQNQVLLQQIRSFDDLQVQRIIDNLLLNLKIDYQWKDFKNQIVSKKYLTDLEEFHFEFFINKFSNLDYLIKFNYFYLHQLLYSTLLLSDKSDVIINVDKVPVSIIDDILVEKYRNRKGFINNFEAINNLKNKAFNDTINQLNKNFTCDNHFYSITLPTGMGKTILSFGVALELRKLLQHQNPKIIISIPFTSIIDQNYSVYNEILEFPDSNILLKHHHLSEPIYKLNDNVLDIDKSQFLIETWNSEIIITTFVQILEVLFTNDKTKLLKFSNLINSIIILDEIQNIPYELWSLIRISFKILADKFDCYFILMSATQPLIFEPKKEIIELVPDYIKYFTHSSFNRTKLVINNQSISFEDFINIVYDFLIFNPEKDVLVILNTKKYCLKCFEELAELLNNDIANIYYLSTLITPYERKQIINIIKNKKDKKQQIIISTQLIEAGVDISVDTVFRSFAPLDSIIQSAGRANRYNEKNNISDVFIYDINEIKKETNLIYGTDLILKTKNIFNNISELSEKNYLFLIEKYFQEVKIQADNITSEEIKNLINLEFKKLGEFSYIKERKSESVFIQINEKAVNVWNSYMNIYTNDSLSIFEKRNLFAEIKSVFYDFVINISIPFDQQMIDFDSEKVYNFYLSKLNQPSSFYKYDENNFRNNKGYLVKSKTICL